MSKIKMKELGSSTQEQLTSLFKGWKFASFGDIGCIMHKSYKEDADNFKNMAVRADDVWVVTYPRSGTTWTQELVWLLKNDLDYDTALKIRLRERYAFLEATHVDKPELLGIKPTDPAKLQDLAVTTPSFEVVANTPSPRFIKTHMPFSLLPHNLLDSKVVYVARDPRDVAVSYYHLSKLYFNYVGDFKTYWSLFIKDLVIYSPFFPHLKEAWELRHHENMLFIFYEDMIKDLTAVIKRLAKFFGKEFSKEEIGKLCEHLDIKNFKNNDAVNNAAFLKELGNTGGETFIRQGKSGTWLKYFDDEMSAQAQSWLDENLLDTDLRFPSHDRSTSQDLGP